MAAVTSQQSVLLEALQVLGVHEGTALYFHTYAPHQPGPAWGDGAPSLQWTSTKSLKFQYTRLVFLKSQNFKAGNTVSPVKSAGTGKGIPGGQFPHKSVQGDGPMEGFQVAYRPACLTEESYRSYDTALLC